MFDTSADWYVTKLIAQDNKMKIDPKREERVNSAFTTRFIFEAVIITLIYWYFWQVSQRYTRQCQRREA